MQFDQSIFDIVKCFDSPESLMDFLIKSAMYNNVSSETFKTVSSLYLAHFEYYLYYTMSLNNINNQMNETNGIAMLIEASNNLDINDDNQTINNQENDAISINTNDYNGPVTINEVIVIQDDDEVISISDDDNESVRNINDAISIDDSDPSDDDDDVSDSSQSQEDYDYEVDEGEMEDGDFEYTPKTKQLFVGVYCGQRNFVNA